MPRINELAVNVFNMVRRMDSSNLGPILMLAETFPCPDYEIIMVPFSDLSFVFPELLNPFLKFT